MTTTHIISVARWIRATTLGWIMGIVVILILSAIIEGTGLNEFQFFMGIGMGAGLGIAQWRLLRQASGITTKWIWYTIIGLGLPFLLFDILKITTSIQLGEYYIIYSVLLAGILVGTLQYLLLRPHFAKAVLWIPATFAGWLLAVLAFLCINYTNHLFSGNWLIFTANVFLILIGGVILGTITGLCLQRLQAIRN